MRATRAARLSRDDAAFVAAARLRAARMEPYLASAVFALVPVPSPGLGTFAVDRHWRLYLDMDQARDWGVEASAAVLLHEAHHVVRDHAGRARAVGVAQDEHHIWNLAADAAINDDLVADGMPLPSPVVPASLGLRAHGVEEHYFAELRAALDADAHAECGSGSGGERLPQELDEDEEETVDEVDAAAVRRDVAHAVVAASDQGDKVSPGLARWARSLLEPQVPWSRVLRTALGRPLRASVARSEPSWHRPDRRGPARPDVLRPGVRRTRPEVAVVVDTSASMSPSLLDAAVTEIDALLRRVGAEVTVVVCDAVAAVPQRVQHLGQLELVGGGGTDLRVGIAVAADLRPVPEVIVVLTDGLTPWPTCAPNRRPLVAVVIDPVVPLPEGPGISAVRIGPPS